MLIAFLSAKCDQHISSEISANSASSYKELNSICQTGLTPTQNEDAYDPPDGGNPAHYSVTHYFANNVQWNFINSEGRQVHMEVNARTTTKLFTGGKAQINRWNLIQLQCDGTEYGRPEISPDMSWPWVGVQRTPLDKSRMRALGQWVGADGNLWVSLPDNAAMDLKLCAQARHYYAWATPIKYPVTIIASTNGTPVDLSTNTPEFCVGQNVTFTLSGLPTGVILDLVGNWQLPAKFVNWQTNYSSTCTTYVRNDDLLQNTRRTSCWFYNTNGNTVGTHLNLHFSNGQYANVAALGNITVFRPSVTNVPDSTMIPSFFTTNTTDKTINIPYVSLGGSDDPRPKPPQHQMEIDVHFCAGKYSGIGGIVQLLTLDYSAPWYPPFSLGYPNFSDWRLDGNTVMYSTNRVDSHPAGNVVYLQDSPARGHPYSFGTIRCKASFKDYCMFQPDGGIPVTIGIVTWSCDGESPSAGVLSTNSVIGPSSPDGSDNFPVWELNWSEGSSGGN